MLCTRSLLKNFRKRSRGIFGKDAYVLPTEHDDVAYRTEFQQAIMPAAAPVHDPDETAEAA